SSAQLSTFPSRSDIKMPDTKRIISPGHPVAITTYMAAAFGGLLPVSGLAEAKGMTDAFCSRVVSLGGTLAFVSGLRVATMALLSRYQEPAHRTLRVACIAVAVACLCWGFYEVALVMGNAFNQVLFTQNWVTWPALGFFWRAIEIIRETRRVRREPKVGE